MAGPRVRPDVELGVADDGAGEGGARQGEEHGEEKSRQQGEKSS